VLTLKNGSSLIVNGMEEPILVSAHLQVKGVDQLGAEKDQEYLVGSHTDAWWEKLL
jgi:hypothetical protein